MFFLRTNVLYRKGIPVSHYFIARRVISTHYQLYRLFSTLRLVFHSRYKSYSECLTTTIQKRNYNRASEIHISVSGQNYVVSKRDDKNCPIQPPFQFLMTIVVFFHQVMFWVGKAFHWNFEKWLLLAKGIVLTRTAAPSGR